MKFLIGVLLLMLSFSLQAVVNAPDSNQFDNLGAIKKEDKKFITVLNNTLSDLVSGQVMTWDLTTDDGAKATMSSTRGDVTVACVLTKACVAGAVCELCQVYGKHDAVLFDADNATATAGVDIFVSGTVAGSIDAIPLSGRTDLQKRFGFFYDAPTVSGNTEVFINVN